ncbi:uncharacterized protein LOC131532186 isoform X2 [Onychostoma macrolepis]|uniref:uncharacterized protein LOC131532186 isoform X2 n=1 Tax=Onychostoma macrolepis TaxID=369639 RepID=UPI00272B782D|nr:uncharacterized protein LOC131532186 isoform X2 [Onychostoma macrolepis]
MRVGPERCQRCKCTNQSPSAPRHCLHSAVKMSSWLLAVSWHFNTIRKSLQIRVEQEDRHSNAAPPRGLHDFHDLLMHASPGSKCSIPKAVVVFRVCERMCSVSWPLPSASPNLSLPLCLQVIQIMNLREEFAELSEHAVTTHSFSLSVLDPKELYTRGGGLKSCQIKSLLQIIGSLVCEK